MSSLAVPAKVTILEFGADWCRPCREARPHLEELARRPNVAVRLIDVDECPDFAARQHIGGIPTFIVIDRNGVVLRRVEGAAWSAVESALPR